jgi:hypothetical protein
MRFLLIGLSAAFLALPVSAPVQACEEYAASAQATPVAAKATSVDLSAEEKKTPKKKVAMKKKKEKVEYMRAAPMPPGAK